MDGKFEKSCGAILYCYDEDGALRYLLIRQCNEPLFYGFPKGHVEGEETELQTAKREIDEEVGLSPQFHPDFREENRYPLPNKPGVTKISVYYLASFDASEPVATQPEEVSDCVLLPYQDAMAKLRSDMQVILSKANQYILQRA